MIENFIIFDCEKSVLLLSTQEGELRTERVSDRDRYNYETLKRDLEDKRFYTVLDYTSEKDIKENLRLAQEEYDKGNISISYNYINRIWL